MSPKKNHEGSRYKKGSLNVISGGFASGGETSISREVYVSQILETSTVGKRFREKDGVVISFLEEELGHVTTPHEDALVITA